MPVNIRLTGKTVVLGNFSRLLDDPRHVDASRDVRALLEEGHRQFVIDLGGLRELSSTGLALLTTITRLIRQYDGEAVLAHFGRGVATYLDEMRMDAYWEMFPTVDEAVRFFQPAPPESVN